jgi:hypothetical protein
MSTDEESSSVTTSSLSDADADERADEQHAVIALDEKSLQPQQHGGGNGDQERFIDKTSPQENDGRSETVTGFDPRDAPSGERVFRQGEWMDKWEWLNQLNDGVQDKERGKQNWQAGKLNDAKLIADHLSLPPNEREKLLRMAVEIDFNNFGSYSSEQVLVACSSLVSDENTTVYENRIILRDEFRELMETFDMGSKDHQQIRQAIRERTNFYG